MAIQEDPTRGSEPAGGAARLFAALLVNDSFCWTRITHKLRHREEKKAVKCHQNRRSYQHHPSAACDKARAPSASRSLSCLSAMHILFYKPLLKKATYFATLHSQWQLHSLISDFAQISRKFQISNFCRSGHADCEGSSYTGCKQVIFFPQSYIMIDDR